MKKKKEEKENYGVQQNLIDPNPELKAILEFICSESHKLTNCAIYYARQMYFKTRKIVTSFDLIEEYKNNIHYQTLYSQTAQQTLINVGESFQSFKELNRLSRNGKLNQKPKPPGYRKGEGLAMVTYPKQALEILPKGCFIPEYMRLHIPLGRTVKRWFGLDSFHILMPTNLNFEDIVEVRILPRNKCFYVEFVYKIKEATVLDLDFKKVLGIDHGVNNWLTCVSNFGTSFIIDGYDLKSKNQWYNKQIAKFKKDKPQGFWNENLSQITEKRNRQMRDGINKAARFVINYCLKHKIGVLVFGWNKGQKQNSNMSKRNNQKFIQIPTGRLKDRIEELCTRYGIQFIETEESYTSKTSFLDNDVLPTFGAKPEGWKSTGNRVKRGIFKTAKKFLINADCNGAANIIRKVAATLGLDLSGVSRACLTTPIRIILFVESAYVSRLI